MQFKYYFKNFLFLLLWSSFQFVFAENISGTFPDWDKAENSDQLNSIQCSDFRRFAVNSKDFNTEGLIVIKDGVLQYEHYDLLYGPNTPHILWSVSKTITATLLGIAEREGKINSENYLFDYYQQKKPDKNFKNIKIKNLLYLDTGMLWNEKSHEVDENPLVAMLFGAGKNDMAQFASNQKIIKQGPGYRWNYSTGTPTITMGILKKIYGANDTQMPWRNLFNPLGMTSAVFEKDHSGTFIGGSATFATPRDMAKLGYLYLNKGKWNGEIILTEEWMKKMMSPSPGYISRGTVITDITKEGVYGGSFWLNQEVKKGLGKPYPHVPEDMYMALGLYGQFIIMLPTQKMIIVRTGYDNDYHYKIDEFISRAISCFDDPNYKIGISKLNPHNGNLGLSTLVRNVKNGLEANTLQGGIAKIICSCHYVSGIDIPTCIKRNNFSMTKLLTKVSARENPEPGGEVAIQVRLNRFARLFKLDYGNSAKAIYNPEFPQFGCTLK